MCLPATHKQGVNRTPQRSELIAALLLAAIACSAPAARGADLTPAAERAFAHYIALTEMRIKQHSGPEGIPQFDANPAERDKLRDGALLITSRQTHDRGKEIDVPDALVQDWLGSIFIPNTTIAQVRSVMQAYPDYKRYFLPEVIESKILTHEGDHYTVFLRLYKKQILTVVLNATYDIRYTAFGPKHLTVDSRSTRIGEVKDAKGSFDRELPIGHDSGFLWRLNSYWKFEEADGGVYAQCEAVSLSRDLPFGLFMIRRFIDRFPKESMQQTLQSLRRAVEHP